ncbi:hypothetical protein Sme01_46060 [Sphaerisporangium melleum]|uniref:Uncharacterized protein n=2 Tax=Sphaerisporangium melleum TaxID=321316 RepID=A0A917VHU8_9ACTN|nr:hypothetical protein [Sphaerisporangium melleum]GGK79776.1 hypothetical protein GCM10007964_23020 [Sphaerisporangium melleum]GII72130.1 hypothetical protein Sme01_46060 [Sphaerisporangium melleum]
MHDHDASRPRGGPVRRWLSRVTQAVFGREPLDTQTPAPILPVTSTTRVTRTLSFPTPAKSDAYDFTIEVDFCLCVTGTLQGEPLRAKIDRRLADLLTVAQAAARPVARTFPPFRPGPAEPAIAASVRQAVGQALVSAPDEDGLVFECTTAVRVHMDPAIRDLQRRSVTEQIQFESRYELSEQAADRLGELRGVWSKFIKDGLPHWETPYAVVMAQKPAQAADTLFRMRKDRQAEARDLVGTVAKVAEGHERMDLLEFVLATDSALGRTYDLLGIAHPEAGPQSLFDEAEEVTGR